MRHLRSREEGSKESAQRMYYNILCVSGSLVGTTDGYTAHLQDPRGRETGQLLRGWSDGEIAAALGSAALPALL